MIKIIGCFLSSWSLYRNLRVSRHGRQILFKPGGVRAVPTIRFPLQSAPNHSAASHPGSVLSTSVSLPIPSASPLSRCPNSHPVLTQLAEEMFSCAVRQSWVMAPRMVPSKKSGNDCREKAANGTVRIATDAE